MRKKPCFVTATVIFNNKMQRSGGADYITRSLAPTNITALRLRNQPLQLLVSDCARLGVDNQNIINALRLLQVHLIQHRQVNRRNIGKADIAIAETRQPTLH